MKKAKARELRRKIEQAAQHIPEIEAYDAVWMYPVWTAAGSYTAGSVWMHADKLWRCRQSHDGQASYAPSTDTASLWELIPPPGEDGSIDRPIAYAPGMALTEGLYYTQSDVLYLCTRDTGGPVYHDLSALVGLYVEVVS